MRDVDVMSMAFESSPSKTDNKEIDKILLMKFENDEVPLITHTGFYRLVNEQSGWKVFLDWKKHKPSIAVTTLLLVEHRKKK